MTQTGQAVPASGSLLTGLKALNSTDSARHDTRKKYLFKTDLRIEIDERRQQLAYGKGFLITN
jgi:hypothetical protein